LTIIGVDVHGTIDANPEFFEPYLRLMTKMGHILFIISGPPKDQIVEELEQLEIMQGVHYSTIISVVDYLRNCGEKMWQDEKQTWWCKDEVWWASKARICAEFGLTHMIDDKIEYLPEFKKIGTIFILWEGTDASTANKS